MTKYLNTREGSIEQAVEKTVEQNITFKKEEVKIKAPVNRYLDTRDTSLEAAVTRVVSENAMWETSAKEQEEIKEKSKYFKAEEDYQDKFKKALEKTGKSISQISDDEKKKFFDKMDDKHTAKDEAVDPEQIQNLRQKITDTSNKMTTIDTKTPEEKAKAELMASQLKTDKLKLQDMLKKQSEDDKTVKEGDEGKSYKSYKDMKKETAKGKNMKTTMTKKPVTPIEIDPKLTFKDGSM